MRLFAIPLAAILGALSLLHAYWALGGRAGSAYTIPVVNGRRAFEPGPAATWIVCGLLALAAFIAIGKAGYIASGLPPILFTIGTWGLAVVFFARAIGNLRTFGFLKSITGTDFARWDTWLYSPLCLVIAALAAGLALRNSDAV
ncbi:MAG TPA: DUF3995 domain-containing protein [Bryobacteraceae bacterium]|jgi:hypothetical protein